MATSEDYPDYPTPRYLLYKGGFWRWICWMRGHVWSGSNHPRIVECDVCDAEGVL